MVRARHGWTVNTLTWLVLCFWLALCLSVGSSQEMERAAVADGELHDIQFVTLDRMIAVGDRGLILGSDNAGKTWSVRNSRSEFTLYSVCFVSETVGCAVGGAVDPFTHRSRGVALVTSDGGKSWVRSQSNLPRLTGVALESSSGLLAWGDWSTTEQSSIFVSKDNGLNWTPISAPCGHIESIGVERLPAGQVQQGMNRFGVAASRRMVIDRLSRCFFADDGVNYELVPFPGVSSDEPIRSCCHSGVKWWVCGDNGLLFSSEDGKGWTQHFLPGLKSDWDLISLRDMVAYGNEIWICGNPGSVVWYSNDGGQDWNVIPTNSNATANALSTFETSVVAYAGAMATINVSRNNGSAWRLSHQSTSRLSTLNVASSADRIAWDLLAVVSKDARQTAGCIVVHDQNLEQRSAYRPEQAVRTALAAKRMELATAETFASFPISDSVGQPRWTDTGHYAQNGSLLQAPTTKLFRKLVHTIRASRPDLIVTECGVSGSILQKKLSQSVELATTWASRRDYALFSDVSKIPNNQWTVQRTLYRGELNSGRQFHPSMILKSVGMVLGETVGPALAIANTPDEASLNSHGRLRYRSGANASASLLNPLDGLTLDGQTTLKEKLYGASRAGLLVSTANWFNSGALLKHEVSNPLVRDTNWEAKLSQSAKMIEPESRAVVLIDIARDARRSGNWNMWSSTLEYLIANDSKSPYAEFAQLELMRYTGSAEVNQMLSKLLQSNHSKNEDLPANTTIATQYSPFGKDGDTNIKPASYAHRPQRIPIATSYGLPEFYRSLANIPDAWVPYRFDPEWGWLIASRFRQYQSAKSATTATDPYQLHLQSSNFFPRLSENLLNWQMVQSQENYLNRQSEFADNTRNKSLSAIPKTSERPHLDGEPNEEMWTTALRLELKDPWGESGATTVAIVRDDEFIYLLSQSVETEPVTNGSLNSVRKRDSLSVGQNSIRLRIDLDRDYATWFEFGWSDSGEVIDLCNDMLSWNPEWYMATKPTAYGWNAEIAIPIEELISTDNPISTTITHVGINVIHSVPGRGARVMAPAVSDRFQSDQWTIIKW
jgi:photosystem II stability/assembly factor-like uncharacterized protein